VTDYDSVLVVGFGGPEGPDEVMPFLENVLRGRNVPRERMLAVAEHYQHFGGVSPLNGQVRELIAALGRELAEHGPRLPIYWGNRNWKPMLADTLRQMQADGVRRAVALVLAAYSSYSSCRQYRENIADAQAAVGSGAPVVDKLRVFYNHPHFIAAWKDRLDEALAQIPVGRRAAAEIIFTAHSIPSAMAVGSRYAEQLAEACRLAAEAAGHGLWTLAYQSRSGPPAQPWLGPDVCDLLRTRHAERPMRDVVIAPIGFLSDHMEVLFDLDTEARDVAEELGVHFVRAGTPHVHPKMIEMYRLLIEERVLGTPALAIGKDGPSHDECAADCCLSGRPVVPPETAGQ
jgi:ferrochelatase